MGKGNIIGKPNEPSVIYTKGIWDLRAQAREVKNGKWPPSGLINNGLTCFIDLANPICRTTGALLDLSGNNNNATGVGYSFGTGNGGVVSFSGSSSSYATIPLNYTSGTYSIVSAVRYSGATRGRTISCVGNNWLMGHWDAKVNMYYAEGWVTATTGTVDTNWRINTATGNSAADSWALYDGTSLVSSNSGGSQGPNQIRMGGGYMSNGTEFSTCEIGFIMVFNRVITTDEIAIIFNGFRGRYGL